MQNSNGKFLSECVLRIDGNGGAWVVIEPVVYQSGVAGTVLTIPAGFRTDLASVPRLPVVFLLFGGTAHKAAVVHDYLYTVRTLDRHIADAVLWEASAAIGVPAWRRWLMWAAVRVFGRAHWR